MPSGRGRSHSQSAPGDILGCVYARSSRPLCCLCVIAMLISAGVCAPVAVAASASSGNSFSELTEGGKEATETTASTTSTSGVGSSSSSGSGTVLLLAIAAAGVLIAGIAFLIMRDAHSVAPVSEGQLTGVGRSGRDPAATMRKRRAKAKAARRQRKRTR